MASDGTRGDNVPNRVVGVVTHSNVDGLRRALPEARRQAAELDAECIVVASGADRRTRKWLRDQEAGVTVLRLTNNEGPAGGYNAVLRARPDVHTYVLLNDDLLLTGGELPTLVRTLEGDDCVGLVCGLPATEEGAPLADSFVRRPLEEALGTLWSRWWGEVEGSPGGDLVWAEAVGGSNMVLRGQAVREVGEFDTALWPAGFEDMDYAARLRFRGWGVAVHRGVLVRESVSATTSRVFGPRYAELRRSSGLLYAAMNYPLSVAAGRMGEAVLRALTAADPTVRRGDAGGLLRCARLLPHVLKARRRRAHLRQLRSYAPVPG